MTCLEIQSKQPQIVIKKVNNNKDDSFVVYDGVGASLMDAHIMSSKKVMQPKQ